MVEIKGSPNLEDQATYYILEFTILIEVKVHDTTYLNRPDKTCARDHRRSWHGPTTPLFLTFCLQIYFQ
jgi:hypothetical protein